MHFSNLELGQLFAKRLIMKSITCCKLQCAFSILALLTGHQKSAEVISNNVIGELSKN